MVQGIKKRFYNNVNTKTLKSIEEIVTAVALMHNIAKTLEKR